MAYSGKELEIGSYSIALSDKIGQGTFGVVYVGRHIKSGEKVAVKQCEIQSDKHGFMAMKEIKNFKQLDNHPNIVQLFDFHYTKNSFWMIMEFCDCGDLSKYLKRNRRLKMEEKVDFMHQAASAIAFMHSRPNPVVHRDVKPANLMLKTAENGKVILKVTDFGLSKVIEDTTDPAATVMLTTAAGTPGFMAPEFFLKEPYTASVDVFALGLVFLAMIDYKPGDADLIPLSASKKKKNMIMPVGMEMAQLYTMEMPQPQLTQDTSDDTQTVKAIKRLINNMAIFDPKSRIKMAAVEQTLVAIKCMDFSVDSIDSIDSIDSSDSSDSSDIGFMLLKEPYARTVLLDELAKTGATNPPDLGGEGEIGNNVSSTDSQDTPEAVDFPSYQEIDRDMITFETDEKGKKVKLGDGGFAVVYLGKYKLLGNTKVALKRIKKSEYGIKDRDQKALKQEAATMFKARHPDILAIYGLVCDDSVESDQLYCLVTEYMEMGSLDDIMEKVLIPWDIKVKVMCCIAKGLDYLCNLDIGGNRKLVHGDVKAKNILIDGHFKAKIGDFGLSILQTITSTSTGVFPKGTLTHMAPEILDIPTSDDGTYDPKPTEKSDVWSFGVTMFEAAADVKCPGSDHPAYRTPFPAGMQHAQIGTRINRQMNKLFTPNEKLKIPEHCPPFYMDTMERCCTVDKDQRPDFKGVLSALTEGYDSVCQRTFFGSMIQVFQQVHREVPDEAALMRSHRNEPPRTRMVTINDNPSVHTYPSTSGASRNTFHSPSGPSNPGTTGVTRSEFASIPKDCILIPKNELQNMIEEVRSLRVAITKSDTQRDPEAVRQINQRSSFMRERTENFYRNQAPSRPDEVDGDRFVTKSELDNLKQDLLKIQSDTRGIMEMQATAMTTTNMAIMHMAEIAKNRPEPKQETTEAAAPNTQPQQGDKDKKCTIS